MTSVIERAPGRSLLPEPLFNRLVGRIAQEHGFEREFAERIMDQAMAFLGACAQNEEAPLSPSKLVDIGWHIFLLHTAAYSAWCQFIADRFIHHQPDDDAGAEPTSDPQAVLDKTVAAIEAAGYQVDRELWDADGQLKCHQCHAGCTDSPDKK